MSVVGQSPGDGGESPGGQEITRAGPNLGFGLVADKKTNIGEGLLELNTEGVRRGSGEIVHARSHPEVT